MRYALYLLLIIILFIPIRRLILKFFSPQIAIIF
jgi:hypothetical protein